MRAVSALWRSSHPGPTLVVTALAIVLGVAAGLDAARLALLAAAVFARGSFPVRWSNDGVDARRDTAVGRGDKPIARGEIAVTAVWTAADVAAAVALVLSVMLGPLFLAVHVVALASAWAYNLGLKRTAASVVPFIVSFGLFPSLATLARSDASPAAPWAWVAGAALGVAVHFSNVLPDLDDDAATGVRGLPHRLGGRASSIWAFVAVEVGAVVVLAGPLLVGLPLEPPAALGFALVTAVASLGLARALRRQDHTVFRLVMLAALLLALQLAVTGVGLVAR